MSTEIRIKQKTKKEIAVGYFRIVQPSVGNKKDVWIFDDRFKKSVAIKELDFETVLRKIFNINLLNKGAPSNGTNVH